MPAEAASQLGRDTELAIEPAFRAPLLRVLDARGRADVRAAAQVRKLVPGEVVFGAGEAADTLFIVASGAVTLHGPDAPARVVTSEVFGREALVAGARRNGRAIATESGVVLEVPLASLRRALTRSGCGELLAREENAARQRAWRAMVRSSPFGLELDARAFDALANEWHEETFERGARWLERGEARDWCWFVVRGLVELSEPLAHAASGDWVGLGAVLAGRAHERGATALAEVTLLRVPGARLRAIASQHPRALAVLAAAIELRAERQRRLRAIAARGNDRHAFHEVERLENASSLLAIDLDTCVRCGQCSAACAHMHGTSRFDRQGPKIHLHLRLASGGAEQRALILTNACQHCHAPTCLPECPTGALTRSPSGSMLIRAELCTGCGACARACGFDAIRLEPSQVAAGVSAAALVASQCDLCRGQAGPACVSVCPTGAAMRLSPRRDVVEISPGAGQASSRRNAEPSRPLLATLRWCFLLPPLVALTRLGRRSLGPEAQLASGVVAGILCLALILHALVKRQPLIRNRLQRWSFGMKRGLSPLVRLHALAGAASVALTWLHAGFHLSTGVAGALTIVFYLCGLSGVFGAIVYRVLPTRLTRWERHSAPASEREREREELRQRWFEGSSAQNAAVKQLAERVLVPYVTAPFGPLALVISGRTIGAEVVALERHVERLLGGRKSERLADTQALIETAVELRALGARRCVEGLLVFWVPCHLVLAAALMVLLLVHAVGALW